MMKKGLRRILVVDDEKEIVNLLLRRLRFADFEAEGTSNPEEARSLIAGDRYAVVLCDLQMPGPDGLELLSWTKQRDPALCFIIMSGYVDEEIFQRMRELGAEACVLKPLDDLDKMVEIVEACHRKLARWETVFDQISKSGPEK